MTNMHFFRTLAAAALGLACLVSGTPASATLYCEIRKTPDGFVALRDGPGANSRMILRIRPGDTVLVQNDPGAAVHPQWDRVLHWRREVYQKLRKQGREDASLGTTGWVNRRFYVPDSCG